MFKFMYYMTMDYRTFKKHVSSAGLEIKEFAKLMDMNHRSISNYSKCGKVPDQLALIVLMMVELWRHGIDCKEIFAKLDSMGRLVRKRGEGGFRGKQQEKL